MTQHGKIRGESDRVKDEDLEKKLKKEKIEWEWTVRDFTGSRI